MMLHEADWLITLEFISVFLSILLRWDYFCLRPSLVLQTVWMTESPIYMHFTDDSTHASGFSSVHDLLFVLPSTMLISSPAFLSSPVQQFSSQICLFFYFDTSHPQTMYKICPILKCRETTAAYPTCKMFSLLHSCFPILSVIHIFWPNWFSTKLIYHPKLGPSFTTRVVFIHANPIHFP